MNHIQKMKMMNHYQHMLQRYALRLALLGSLAIGTGCAGNSTPQHTGRVSETRKQELFDPRQDAGELGWGTLNPTWEPEEPDLNPQYHRLSSGGLESKLGSHYAIKEHALNYENGSYVPNLTLDHLVVPELDGKYPDLSDSAFIPENQGHNKDAYDDVLKTILNSRDMDCFLKDNHYGIELDKADFKLRAYDVEIPLSSLEGKTMDEARLEFARLARDAGKLGIVDYDADVWAGKGTMAEKRAQDTDAYVIAYLGAADGVAKCRVYGINYTKF